MTVPAIHNQQSPCHLGKTGPEYGYRIAQLIVAGGDGRHVSRIPPGAFGPLTKKKSKIKIQIGAATMPAAQLSRTGKTKILRLWLWLALPQNPRTFARSIDRYSSHPAAPTTKRAKSGAAIAKV